MTDEANPLWPLDPRVPSTGNPCAEMAPFDPVQHAQQGEAAERLKAATVMGDVVEVAMGRGPSLWVRSSEQDDEAWSNFADPGFTVSHRLLAGYEWTLYLSGGDPAR